MELTERKKQILKIVVDSYIATAEPVGSKAIVELMPEKVSSATVRNELADLTEMGYLEQPHTSAGRIPSAKGYRLYVNELMERKALSAEETEKINTALSGPLQQVDQVISQAGQMVSSFVGYPTYSVADHRTAATVQRFELIGVDARSFIAVVMLSDNRVKSQLMALELPLEAEALPQLSHLLNTHFTGVGPEKMNGTLMQPVGAGVRPVVLTFEPGDGVRLHAAGGKPAPAGVHQRRQPAAEVPGVPGHRQGPRPDELYGGQQGGPACAPERRAYADPHRAGERERRPEGEQRGHRQLRHRRQYARTGGRGRTDPYGLRRCGGAAELLCGEPEPYVW